MFDAEMIKACAELYPAEFYGLCVLATIMITIGSVLMVALAGIWVEG